MQIKGKRFQTVWAEGDSVCMINQPLLPHKFSVHKSKNHAQTARAIKTMVVRGAGAIGATAAYGLAQAALEFKGDDLQKFNTYIDKAYTTLADTRPTAQDLFTALDFVNLAMSGKSVASQRRQAVRAAKRYAQNDVKAGLAIGKHGSKLIRDGDGILTHCNAGALAFVDHGSALSPIFQAHKQGKRLFVFVDETRPRLQGARLTAWELKQAGILHAVIADNASGHFMQQGMVDLCITGADRVARDGDVANKIGTYEKAVLAKENRIPFYIAIPWTTFDPACKSGKDIPIEERGQEEVTHVWGAQGRRRASVKVTTSQARNPAFDVTPARYITGIITPDGIFKPKAVKKAHSEASNK